MQPSFLRISLSVIALASLGLVACAERGATSLSSLEQDDDVVCRANNVAVGSSGYIACRRDRDVLRDRAAARADRGQRDLAEHMLNHPN